MIARGYWRTTLQVSLMIVLMTLAVGGASGEPASNAGSCLALAEPAALTIEEGSGITPPKPLYRAVPETPSGLGGRQVTATVEAVIGVDGRLRQVCVSEGNQRWGRAMAVALKNWQFEPATLEGKPVAVRFKLTATSR